MKGIWVLGSMGWMPSAGQQTCCVLVELGDELIMLDAGTGVSNLSLCRDVLDRHDHLSIILSHYHLDHVTGLMYLKRFVADKRVDVYGPGKPVYARTTESYFSQVLQPVIYSSGHRGFAREVHYHDYGGHDFSVGNVQVRVRAQQHSAPSFELRLDDVLVYATDTSFDPAMWADVAPAQVLLHECWQGAEGDPRHTSLDALEEGLPRGVFGQVALLHQNPAWTKAERKHIADAARRRGFGLAYDGMKL